MTTDHLAGLGDFKYRCESGHLTQSVLALPDDATCWHCPGGVPCHGELYQESPKKGKS